jgi:Sulfotransferase domain
MPKPVLAKPVLAPDSSRILVACMPKSGSTYLSAMVSCLPEMRRAYLYQTRVERREQELDLMRLREEEERTLQLRSPKGLRRRFSTQVRSLLRSQSSNNATPKRGTRGYVCQHHVRYSSPTERIIADYDIKPIVLVRNIFDATVSLRDHLIDQSVFMSMGYFSEDMRNWPEDQVTDFLVDMVVPWYINFFVCWQECPDKLMLTYEELRQDPIGCLEKVANKADLHVSRTDCENARELAKAKKTRLNKGVEGRGDQLSRGQREKIAAYTRYYPKVDFSPIGLCA